MRILILLTPSSSVPGCRAVSSAGALQVQDVGGCFHVDFDPRATDMTQCVSFEEKPQSWAVQYGTITGSP